MRNLLEEIESYPEDYLENLILDQEHHKKFIDKYCTNCKNHNIIDYIGIDFYVCNDNYSGKNAVGDHILYSETIDICIECKGFTKNE